MKPNWTWAMLVALLLGAAACAPEGGCPGDWCGTAVVVTSSEPDVLLPQLSTQNVGREIGEQLFDKLADIGRELNTFGDRGFVPVLARAWRFEDSLTISFALHPEARWHDGTPVTARDVVFTFDVYRDTLVNAPGRPRLDRVASVTARDSLTAVFRFREVYPEQFFDAVYHLWILPRHLLDSIPRARLASHPFGREPVGSGPFRFVRWQAAEFVELAADSAYYRGRPGLRRVLWRFTPNPATAFTQLLAGDADILQVIPPRPEDLARVDSAQGLRAVPYAIPVYTYVGFNLRDPANPGQPHPLFGTRDLRRALSMAVDQEAVVRAVFGGLADVPVGPVPRAQGIWSDTIARIQFDSAGAGQLLDRLGWRDRDGDGIRERGGQRLTFELMVPSSSAGRVRSAQVIQEQLRRVGVAMEVAEMEFNAMLNRAGSGRFDAVFGGRQEDPSPRSLVEAWTRAGFAGANYSRYDNPEVSRLIRAASRTGDADSARAQWHRALAHINADAPAIWVYEPKVHAGVHRRIENVSIRPDMWCATLWTWRVAPDQRIDRDRLVVN